MAGQFYYYQGLQFILETAFSPSSLTLFNATTAEGSATISNVSSYDGLFVGQQVAGPNIPAGTYILDLDNESGVITLSQPASASGAASPIVGGGSYQKALTLTVHLLQGTIPASDTALFGNFAEADYDGYAPQALELPPIITAPPPRAYAAAQFPTLNFEPTDFNVTNNITGFLVTITPPGTSTPLPCWSEQFQESQGINYPGDAVVVNPVASLVFDGTQGLPSPTNN